MQLKNTRDQTNSEIGSLSERIIKQVNTTQQLASELEERDAAQSTRTEGVLGLLKSEMTRVNVTLERDAHKTVVEKARIEALHTLFDSKIKAFKSHQHEAARDLHYQRKPRQL